MAKGQMRSNREKKKPKKTDAEKSKGPATGAAGQSAFLQPPPRDKGRKREG
jgi:hypothetical protein